MRIKLKKLLHKALDERIELLIDDAYAIGEYNGNNQRSVCRALNKSRSPNVTTLYRDNGSIRAFTKLKPYQALLI